jgi:Kef-type K+ transport system membrane component KefB
MSFIITFSAIFILQVILFHFYRISGLLTGAMFGLIFGPLSLDLLQSETVVYMDSVVMVSIFMLIFYLGLTKPNGEFVKRYVMTHKLIILPTFLTILIVFGVNVLYFDSFDTSIGLILTLAFGIISVSVNSVAMRCMKNHGLFREDVFKVFFAKALPNNFLIVAIFVAILALFDLGDTSIMGIAEAVGTVLLFLLISLIISRYIYPRISQRFKNQNIILLLLFVNAVVQSVIADYMGLNFIIGVFSSSLLIPEIFLKMATLDPIRKNVGILNGYIFVPIFGLTVGINIDVAILFNYELFIPFVLLSFTIWLTQYVLSIGTLMLEGVQKRDRQIITYGTFAKTELAIVILLFSVSYGIIDQEIFTSSIILLGIFNLFAWHRLHNIGLLNYNPHHHIEVEK